MTEPNGRSPRKDVLRNRQRLLEAGRRVFAARGLDATLDDIAHQAGVGAGTAYRHFKSRQDIINAIFSDAANSFTLDAEQSLTIEDPWDGFATFLETFAGRQAADRGLHQVFIGQHGMCVSTDDWERLITAITAVLERAKAAGSVRPDIELSDLVVLFAMLGPAYDISIATSTPIWRRYVDVFLRAARTDTTHATIATPSALSTATISATIGGTG